MHSSRFGSLSLQIFKLEAVNENDLLLIVKSTKDWDANETNEKVSETLF